MSLIQMDANMTALVKVRWIPGCDDAKPEDWKEFMEDERDWEVEILHAVRDGDAWIIKAHVSETVRVTARRNFDDNRPLSEWFGFLDEFVDESELSDMNYDFVGTVEEGC